MLASRTRLRGAAAATAFAAALIGVGAQSAAAADWPALREGAYLYSGPTGTGTVTEVDLHDLGTCHTLSAPARSLQIVSGSTALKLYSGADCTGALAWRSSSLTQTNLPWAMLSYQVVTA
ncbi:hypothetical protein ABZT06_43290 [Streptomyces sp. NPDC005483]|uniref:hypothetical protein n=1 Tax=Streptomyces sp. NPDC005483 TaxID=3154882 RepID=UPI0033BF67A1